MLEGRLVIAYHGCTQGLKNAVLRRQARLKSNFELSKERNIDPDEGLWLGNGIYFFEDNLLAADWWAIEQRHHKKPAVLGAIIDLGHCLDLASFDGSNALMEAAEEVFPDDELTGKTNRSFRSHQKDYALIERVCLTHDAFHTPYDTVRCPFVQGSPIGLETALGPTNFRMNTHIEICVRNPRQILYFFDPDYEQATIYHQIDPMMETLTVPVFQNRTKSF